ncbi:WXG100 family type VII secretion target [Actinacidiphila alni]|uniref:WXG100 family type VII secretion target n=1 Tax=Actinacidiphila alni TaxID=380248 RepID=UPI003453A2B8
MADTFSVDTEGLDGQLPYMQHLAERFNSVHSTLQARLGAVGECWGDDSSGRQFLNQYARPKEEILEAMEQAGEVLRSTGDGLRTMAHGYEVIEEENAAASRQLNAPSVDPDVPGDTGGGRRGSAHS